MVRGPNHSGRKGRHYYVFLLYQRRSGDLLLQKYDNGQIHAISLQRENLEETGLKEYAVTDPQFPMAKLNRNETLEKLHKNKVIN